MQIFSLLFGLIALLYAIHICFFAARRQEIQFIKVIDGDSVEINGLRCRLFGIDAPEWHQPGGSQARAHLISLLKDQHEKSYLKHGVDPNGRLLVTIYGDEDLDLNGEMVAAGQAEAYLRYSLRYQSRQAYAKSHRLGIWANPGMVPAELYRRSHAR